MTVKKFKSGSDSMAVLPSGAVATILSPNAGAKPTNLELKAELSGDWAEWGSSNDLPTVWREKIKKSTTAYPLLWKAVCLLFGNGVVYYTETREGEKIIKNFDTIPEIEEFFEANDIDMFMIEQLMDYKFFGNQFSEYIFNGLGAKVMNVYHKEAEFCRLSVQNKKTKKIEKLGYSGKWGEIQPDTINLLDTTEMTPEGIVKQAKKGKNKLAVHVKFPSPGETYYGFPPHGAIYRENGWLDYSNGIPEIMNGMLKSISKIKFHIQIPYDYWPTKYETWHEKTEKERSVLIDEELDRMDEWLQKSENAYGTFISHYATDPVSGKYVSGWKIEPIEDKLKKDEWIPGTQEADQQLARAINIDSSMSNIQPQGGKMGAGSGSDKRTALVNSISLSKAEQKIVFQPLNYIKRINGWPSNVKFAFSHTAPTTLDKNPTGQKTEA